MKLQVTGQDKLTFKIGGSKLGYRLHNLVGFWGRYWLFGTGIVLGIAGIIYSGFIDEYYIPFTLFSVVLGFILSSKFEIHPATRYFLGGIFSLIPLAILVFFSLVPDIKLHSGDGNVIILDSGELFLLIVLFELAVVLLLLVVPNPPPTLVVDPVTREMRIRDEGYTITRDAVVRINRKGYFETNRGGESSSTSYNYTWDLFITQVGENDRLVNIPLYKIKRSSSFPILKVIFVIKNTKKWDGWIKEVAVQLGSVLDLKIDRNYLEDEEIKYPSLFSPLR